MLASLLAVRSVEVRSAAMGALMMITTVDAGKSDAILLEMCVLYVCYAAIGLQFFFCYPALGGAADSKKFLKS